MKFTLSRKPNPPGSVLTKFHVLDGAGSIIGSINVASEAAADLEKHWLGATQPKVAARGMLAAMLAAGKRSEPAPAAAGDRQRNPMVSAMLRVARRNPMSRGAILRG